MKIWVVLLLSLILGFSSGGPPISEDRVTSSLYHNVLLPCNFPFVDSLTGLTVIWKKVENQRDLIVYKVQNGEVKLEDQDPRYRGRAELAKGVSHGNLHLILRHVTYEDEGTYECRVANRRRNGNKRVTLATDRLHAGDPTVTRVTTDGKRHMKCVGTGHYHEPHVQWITAGGEDLSLYGRLNVIKQDGDWKLVESVLDYDLEPNVQVLCHIEEGRLRRSTRGIISDGKHPVVVDDSK
ncbi:T-lymphocyte activation antigen CD80-like [Dendropsophus ebraccatus]|uniref:T-lymphocyte activation antigen CD80-like n=1 Tax=Dendropsophus ebraccatus TaxID=150705 RepID=UPI00383225E0